MPPSTVSEPAQFTSAIRMPLRLPSRAFPNPASQRAKIAVYTCTNVRMGCLFYRDASTRRNGKSGDSFGTITRRICRPASASRLRISAAVRSRPPICCNMCRS